MKRLAATAVNVGLSIAAKPWGMINGVASRTRREITDPKRILIVRLDHIGDYTLTLPAITAIRRAWPEAKITGLVGSWAEPLAHLTPALDEVRVIDPPWWLKVRGQPVDQGKWREEKRTLLAEFRASDFDLAIDFRGDMRQILHFLWGVKARSRVALDRSGGEALLTHRVTVDPEMHVAHQALAVLRAMGLDDAPPEGPHLREDPEAGRWTMARISAHFNDLAPKMVLVQAGARVALRAWPPERFATVIDHLHDKHGIHAVLAGDDADTERCEAVVRNAKSNPLNLCGQTTLVQAVSLALRSSLFLGNDSGLLHLAAVCDLPVIGLYGPNHPRRCGPVGVPHRIARREFECSPCLQVECPHTDLPEGQCMQELSVEEVIAAADDLLGSL